MPRRPISSFKRPRRRGLKAPIRAWHAAHRQQLTSEKDEDKAVQALVRRLEEAYTALRQMYHGTALTTRQLFGLDPADIDLERQNRDQRSYDRLIRKMIRCGLNDHPLVQERLPHLRMRRGRGRPLKWPSTDDLILTGKVDPMLDRGLSLSAIHGQHPDVSWTYPSEHLPKRHG